MVNVESTTALLSGADGLQMVVPGASSVDAQFIECERGSDIEFRVSADGDVTADGTYTGPADFAEMIRVTSGAASVEPGDVLVIDPHRPWRSCWPLSVHRLARNSFHGVACSVSVVAWP